MHLDEVVAGAGCGQFHEVQADGSPLVCLHREGEGEPGWEAVLGLDVLAGGAGAFERGGVALEGGPPHREAGQQQFLVVPEVAAHWQRGGVELLKHSAAEVRAVWHAQNRA